MTEKDTSYIKHKEMHFHLDKVQDISGFVPINVEEGNYFWLLTRSSITSDEPEFYKYVEQLSDPILNKVRVFRNAVHQFLIIVHKDLSAELYINDFLVAVKIMLKRDVEKGEIITSRDIADIQQMEFPNIEILDTDKVVYCFKVGWKFGLFFDLGRPEKLDINTMSVSLGKLYRELSFQYIYEVLKTKPQFEEMTEDGWFPFIEIIGVEYKSLSEAYQNKFHFEEAIDKLVSNFNKERIEKITGKWWKKPVFNNKKEILQAGINAFLQSNKDGFVNCINTLLPQVEGIIRIQYFNETGKGKDINLSVLLEHVIEKGKTKAGSDSSLLFPLYFFKYLKNIVFAHFDLEAGKVNLSRHTLSHGVAKSGAYTKTKALQAILVLDQIYFYI